MEKQRIFALISAWPRLDFVAVKIIRDTDPCSGRSRSEIYLTDNKEQPSLLFIGKVPEEEADLCIVRLSAWLREYSHVKNARFPWKRKDHDVPDNISMTLSSSHWRRSG